MKFPAPRPLPSIGCFVLLLAVTAWAGLAAGADRLPASKLLPHDTVVYLEIASVSELVDSFKQSNFGRMIADPQIKPFVAHLYDAADRALAQVQERTGMTLAEIASIPQGEISIAVIPTKGEPSEQGRRPRAEIDVVMFVDCGDQIGAAHRLIEKINELLESDGIAPQEERAGETDIALYPGRRRTVALFERDNTVVVCSSAAAARQLLDRWNGTADDASSLSENAQYAAIMNRCRGTDDETPQIALFVDPINAVREASRGNAAAQVGLAFLPALGLDGLKGIGGSIVLSSDDYDAILQLHVLMDNPRTGVLELVDLGAGENTPPSWVPADVAGYTSVHLTPEQAFDKGTRLADSFGFREEGTTAREWNDRAKEGLGVDLEHDLLPALTGRLVHVSWFQRPAQLDVGGLNLIGLKVRDPKQFASTFDAMLKHFGDRLEKVAYSGAEYYKSSEIRDPGDPRPAPCVAMLDDWLLVVDRPAIMEHILARRHDESNRLARALDYKLIASKISRQPGGENPAGLNFSRPEEGWKYLYEIATSNETRDGLRTRAEENPLLRTLNDSLEQNPLPPFSVLARYIAPGGWMLVDDDTGLHFMQFSLRRK